MISISGRQQQQQQHILAVPYTSVACRIRYFGWFAGKGPSVRGLGVPNVQQASRPPSPPFPSLPLLVGLIGYIYVVVYSIKVIQGGKFTNIRFWAHYLTSRFHCDSWQNKKTTTQSSQAVFAEPPGLSAL